MNVDRENRMKTTTLDVTADTFNESSYRDEFPDFGEIDVQIPEEGRPGFV